MWFKLPDVLCHYTSIDGFKGIIEHKKIFATSIRYFEKDPTEFTYSIDFTIRSMQILRKEYPRYDEPFLSEFEQQLNWIREHLETHEFNIFVCSFTTLENEPGQWDEHCPDQNGYCICFDAMKLYSVANQYGAQFEQCLYDEDEQRRKIREALKEGVNEYFHRELNATSSKNQDVQTSARIAAQCFAIIFMTKIAPFLKSGTYKTQEEWRLSLSPEVYGLPSFLLPGRRQTRNGKSIPGIPYVNISLIGDWGHYGRLPFRKIYVGPTADEDGAKKYTEEFLRGHGVDDCEVEKSGIPYRQL